MRNNRTCLTLLSTLTWLLLSGGASAVAAQHDHGSGAGKSAGCCKHSSQRTDQAEPEQALQGGRKGEITLSTDVKVGDLTLKAGSYAVQHFAEASGHYMQFTELGKARPHAYGGWREEAARGKVECRLEPLKTKAARTAHLVSPEDGFNRLTRVEIKGENVAHLF